MYAGEVIDIFTRRLSGAFTRLQYLDEINIAQNEILALPEVPFMRRKGTVYLPTTVGTSEYSVDARTVGRIFYRQGTSSSMPTEQAFNRRSRWQPAPDLVNQGLDVYEEVDVTFDVQEAVDPDDTCTVYLDPAREWGTTTDELLMDAYDWPTQLTSESTRMSLPDTWITTLLFYSVKRKIEESAYGVDIYADPKVQQYLSQFLGKQARMPVLAQTKPRRRF